MGLIGDIINIVVPVVQERAVKEEKSFREILNEELIKIGCQPTDQSKANNHCNKFNSIISEYEDIDNDVIYNRNSGQAIRELDYES